MKSPGKFQSATAGRGDPYWYEWFVGLTEVIHLLDATADVASVTLQEEGVKGWDDVVVRLRSGKRRCYQVKHTRALDSLTFGDLVSPDETGVSLLRSLFVAWRDGGLNDDLTTCILYTNRSAGDRWSTTRDGVRRPPLLDFWKWLEGSKSTAQSIDAYSPDEGFKKAWAIWLSELDPSTDAQKLAFVRSIEIRDKQAELEGLIDRIKAALATAFGVPIARIGALFDALTRALIKWTTGHAEITVEDLFSELALEAEARLLSAAPPPPAPFFPSRLPIVADLERTLTTNTSPPVIFLTGEPGCGKTSGVSYIANRRTDQSFGGIVGARFFCFEPIRPESPFIAPDASRVRPADLWFSLLTQLREGLKGRLHTLAVPIRDEFLQWPQARLHVLRLADHIGREQGRHFVIAIDGIDHAARAAQAIPDQIVEFFASLPSPEELASKSIRLLIAGQPPEAYSGHYPAWLCGVHPQVQRIDLPGLNSADVRALYTSSPSQIPAANAEDAIRVIEANAKGNTLATVFAVAEAGSTATVSELATRLEQRRLSAGLEAYYTSIWNLMLESAAGNFRRGLDPCIAGTISLARKGVQPDLLASAFREWAQPLAQWRTILHCLDPLLIEGPDGFRVRHNDVRVFLAFRFSQHNENERTHVASQLVDYLLRDDSDRLASHLQMFDLFAMAKRPGDAAKVFDVDWIIEGAALGIETDRLEQEGRAAVLALPLHHQWQDVLSVACAIESLARLQDIREHIDRDYYRIEEPLPPFLPSESSVRAVSSWTKDDLFALVRDAARLVEGGERDRAKALLDRWLYEYDVCKLVTILPDIIATRPSLQGEREVLDDAVSNSLNWLGQLSATLNRRLPTGSPSDDIQIQAVAAFEDGYVDTIASAPTADSIEEMCSLHMPMYYSSWATMLRHLANGNHWKLVRSCLGCLCSGKEHLSAGTRADATWWATRSGAFVDDPTWLSPIELADFGLGDATEFGRSLSETKDHFLVCVNVARALGWHKIALDPGDIASRVFATYDRPHWRPEERAQSILALRTAALLGRMAAALNSGGVAEVHQLVTTTQVRDVLAAHWGTGEKLPRIFEHSRTALALVDELADFCGNIGGMFDAVAITVAKPVVATFPFDIRRNGLWSVLERHSEIELLRQWTRNRLGADHADWHSSRDAMKSVIEWFSERAIRVGEADVLAQARERIRWMTIGYSGHKDYSFALVLRWFRKASEQSPDIWKSVGWPLVCASRECERQEGDNRVRSSLLDAVSAAALRCGPSDWWRLVSATHEDIDGEYWHSELNSRLVDAGSIAFESTTTMDKKETLVLMGLSICLSFWTVNGDNAGIAILRDAMLNGVPLAEDQRQLRELFSTISKRCVAEQAPKDEPRSDEGSGPDYLREATLEKLNRGEPILLAEAAAAIAAIHESSADDETVRKLLRATATQKDYVSDWSHVESKVGPAIEKIVRNTTDEQLWALVESVGMDVSAAASSWTHGTHNNLAALAEARAYRRGFDEQLAGVRTQLQMHLRWAYGGKRAGLSDIPTLPEMTGVGSWRDVALRLVPILLNSYSADVLGAALEGVHALVASDETLISDLFDALTTDWSQRWFLLAAESWAVLHSAAIERIRAKIETIMQSGSLGDRLQAWIVLCKHSDCLKRPRPVFPLPTTPSRSDSSFRQNGTIMETGDSRMGRTLFSDRYRSAQGVLRRLRHCGFNFSQLEATIGSELLRAPEPARPVLKGPRRRSDVFCAPLDSDRIVGDAILSVLSTEWCEQEMVPALAQGFLCNEDAWLQRCPPLPLPEHAEWPKLDEHGPERSDESTINARLEGIALGVAVPNGWRTFASCVFEYTWDRDFVLSTWWEQFDSSQLLTRVERPMTLSSRTFLWWLGGYVEPPMPRFVSAFFAGGTRRLHDSSLEIQPAKAWREHLGWSPGERDPLMWYCNGRQVARFERFRGPLRDLVHEPRFRQPALHRWIVTNDAFKEVERVFGALRIRHEFEMHPFKQ